MADIDLVVHHSLKAFRWSHKAHELLRVLHCEGQTLSAGNATWRSPVADGPDYTTPCFQRMMDNLVTIAYAVTSAWTMVWSNNPNRICTSGSVVQESRASQDVRELRLHDSADNA